MFVVIIIFNIINDASVVSMIFKIASYTYGPLLGLFGFAILFKNRQVRDAIVPIICIASPLITLWISSNSSLLFGNYVFDNELIIVNGSITFLLLWLSSKQRKGK